MSSFIMSADAHAGLANTMEYILNSGFNRFGFDAPRSLHDALKDCRDRYGFYCAGLIYSRLYTLNAIAYNGRYKITCEEYTPSVPDMPTVPPLTQPRQYDNYHETLQPWHYQFCKLLDCLIYQASEDVTAHDPLLLALIDFSRVYKSFLVVNTEQYSAAYWGSL